MDQWIDGWIWIWIWIWIWMDMDRWMDGSMDRSIDRQVDRYMGFPPVPPAHPHRSLTPRFCFSAAMFLPGMGAALRCRTL
jgi:hypothetical protein